MFDYVKMSKHLPDGYFDNSRIEYGELYGSYTPLNVRYNRKDRVLTVEGSLPYFVQGHNFYASSSVVAQAIEQINALLGVDMSDAEVKIMEYGVVVQPPFSIDDLLYTHLPTKGYREDIYTKRGKTYQRTDKSYRLKLYSLWANIDERRYKIGSATRTALSTGQCSRANNPIRYEIHGNPSKILGCGTVWAADLMTSEFEDRCKKVLFSKYKKIKKLERIDWDTVRQKVVSSLWLACGVLSDHGIDYQHELLRSVDRLGLKPQACQTRKAFLRQQFTKLPHKKCSYSLENLIVKALYG